MFGSPLPSMSLLTAWLNGWGYHGKWDRNVCQCPRIPMKASASFLCFICGRLGLCNRQTWGQHLSYLTTWPPISLLQCPDFEFPADSPPLFFVVGGPAKPARFAVAETNPHRLILSHHKPISQRSGRKTGTGLEPPSHGVGWALWIPLIPALGRQTPKEKHVFSQRASASGHRAIQKIYTQKRKPMGNSSYVAAEQSPA